MQIKQKISQSRRDFTADYQCEHCGNIQRAYGYDDEYFHQNVIPRMECHECGKTATAPASQPDVPAGVIL